LDAAIKTLLPLAQVPKVAYPELVNSGKLEMLVNLLAHENTDIALDIVELLHELTDEDVGGEDDEEDDEDEGATADEGTAEAALKFLIKSLVRLAAILL
jgi:beta-catenin-like protein 1